MEAQIIPSYLGEESQSYHCLERVRKDKESTTYTMSVTLLALEVLLGFPSCQDLVFSPMFTIERRGWGDGFLGKVFGIQARGLEFNFLHPLEIQVWHYELLIPMVTSQPRLIDDP